MKLRRWLAGGALALVGILGVMGVLKSPARAAEDRLSRARVLLQLDAKQVEAGDEGEGPDLLEEALGELREAAAVRPLDRRVHALRGNIALYFDDKDAEARASFLRERLLNPSPVRVPYGQGLAWIAIDRRETAKLWNEAFERARGREKALEALYGDMLQQARPYRELRKFCVEKVGQHETFADMIIEKWPRELLEEESGLLRSEFARLGNLHALKVLEDRLEQGR